MVDGKYKCSLVYEIKERGISLRHYGILKMYQDENQLKGSMFPTFYWLNSPFRYGKVDDDNFSFTVHFATPCQQFALDIVGSIKGDRVIGTASNGLLTYVLEGVRVD